MSGVFRAPRGEWKISGHVQEKIFGTFGMSWSLRSQMLIPMAALAILFICQLAARETNDFVDHLDDREDHQSVLIASQLGSFVEANLPSELKKLEHANTGWQFAVLRGDQLLASTISLMPGELSVIRALPTVSAVEPARKWVGSLGGDLVHSYLVTAVHVPAWPDDLRLVTFYSYDYAVMLNRQGENFIYAVASVFVTLLIVGVTWYTGRLSRRVRRIQQQVTQIAAGDLQSMIDVHGSDEVDDLARAVNSMAVQLQQMQDAIQKTERTRLQAQLAGGIAHELRNGIHSARLSLEVFREACRTLTLPSESMLQNAGEQLHVTETLVRRLLLIGKPQKQEQIARPLADVLQDVVMMAAPICRHQEIELVTDFIDSLNHVVQDAESIQAAIFNLCLNGIEAMGRHGELRIEVRSNERAVEIRVCDTGPGPDPALADKLFESFVTSKPEGIGLGLVQARQAAESVGGRVSWVRGEHRTEFVIALPTNHSPLPSEFRILADTLRR